MKTLTCIRQLRSRDSLSYGLLREVSRQFDRLVHRTDENSLAEVLRLLGIKPGDIIFVRSAMSRVGHVVGGFEAIIRALKMTVDYEGTIVMPAYPTGGVTYDWVKDSPTFDVKTTPSDVGAVAEVFRLQRDTIRSLHPTHSVSARGPKARFLTEQQESADCPFDVQRH